MIDALRNAKPLSADQSYGAEWFRLAVAQGGRGTAARIASQMNRKVHALHDTGHYHQHEKVEESGRLNDRQYIPARSDSCT